MNSFIGNTECNDYRIGDDTVKALYKGDTLIWEKETPVPVTWDFPFRFNFNTKLWDSTTNTIPNKEGGLETNQFYIPQEGLQYIDIHPNYFDITGASTSYRQLWDFGSWQNNPYVQSNSSCTGTLIFKVKHVGEAGPWDAYSTVMGCRDGMKAYNWYTTSNDIAQYIGMGGTNRVAFDVTNLDEPIMAVTFKDGFCYGYSFNSKKYITEYNFACDYNKYQSRYFYILADNNDPAYCLSKFYWCFYSPQALSLLQIRQVIQYNENL